jgi:tetratricopeptide (TPR) repeat protein
MTSRRGAPRDEDPAIPPPKVALPALSPHHRRTNSDNSIESTAHQRSLFDESNLEHFLPRSLLQDLAVDSRPPPPESPSFETLEATITEQGIDEAYKQVNSFVAAQTDPREKGKLLRAAAEIAKRLAENRFSIDLYAKATDADPQTPASWIDRAKLLDGFGHYAAAEDVLRAGILKAQHTEQLIHKLLRQYERLNTPERARTYLGSMYGDRRVEQEALLTEGALFELRQGRIRLAMDLLNALRVGSGWKPTIYGELVQHFERCGLIGGVQDLVEESSRLNPRNAIVCQTWFRSQRDPSVLVRLLKELSGKWTPEFTDKMTATVCETLAQTGHLRTARLLLAESAVRCAPAQRYKLLLTATTIELVHGDHSVSPLLLNWTAQLTPAKAKPTVCILWAKVCEILGQPDHALGIFGHVVADFATEWRVYLELAQYFLHQNDVPQAIQALADGLRKHPGSGRLWAFRVQLEGFNGVDAQAATLRKAIEAVPKSGEVWCEAARMALNPLSRFFNLTAAKRYLEFAYRFTPQHGDSLVEMVRVELLERGAHADFREIRKKFMCSEGNYGLLFVFMRKPVERPLTDVFQDTVRIVREDIARNRKTYARALARSAFVLRSIATEKGRLDQMVAADPPSRFAFGIVSIGQMILNPALCGSHLEKLSIILGSSGLGQ